MKMGKLFCKRLLGRELMVGFGVVFLMAFCQGLWAQEKVADATNSDPVLIKNEWVEVRKSDYDAFLARVPGGGGRVSNDQKAIIQVLSRLLRDKTLAAQARAEKLDQDPKVKAQLAADIEKFYARLRVEQVEREAGKAFAKREAEYAARAQEMYLTNRKNFELPERVEAAHILFNLEPRGKEEALKLAQKMRAKIVAGEDFGKAAEQHSEDKGSASNKGDLGWFSRAEMVPEFSEAVFALKNAGDISEPVLSPFGWHLILLKGKKEAGLMPFEEARGKIMEEQKQRFVSEYVNNEMAKINDDPKAVLNEEAIDALYIARPSYEEVKKLLREVQSGSAEK
jgi:parvulin-like peptidyl-prolyl isomerase